MITHSLDYFIGDVKRKWRSADPPSRCYFPRQADIFDKATRVRQRLPLSRVSMSSEVPCIKALGLDKSDPFEPDESDSSDFFTLTRGSFSLTRYPP